MGKKPADRGGQKTAPLGSTHGFDLTVPCGCCGAASPRGPAAVASLRERSHLRQEERPDHEPRLNRVVVKGRRRPASLFP